MRKLLFLSCTISIMCLQQSYAQFTKSGSYIYPTTLTDFVGIGTSAPTTQLHIASTTSSPWLSIDKPNNFEGGIQFKRTGTTLFYFHSDNADNDALKLLSGAALAGETDATPRIHIPYTNKNLYFVQSGGNVAMGHSNPYTHSRLHIKSPSAYPWGIIAEASGNDKIIGLGHDGTGGFVSTSYLGTGGYSPLSFRTSDQTRMTIDAAGKVGIGTTAPQMNFELVGSGQIIRNTNGADYTTLRLYNNQNLGLRSLEFDYSGSSYTGALLSGGPTGESGAITTTGAFPLVLGTSNAARMTIKSDGRIGVGTTTPDELLTVNGKIHSKEVIVDLSVPAPDYVFEQNYSLTSLDEVQAYIAQHKHLPEVPSAKELEKDGVKVGEMEMILLKKIEELTLYLIEVKKITESQNKTIQLLENEVKRLSNN